MKKIEQKPNDLFDGYPDEFKNFMTVRLTRSFFFDKAFEFDYFSIAKI